MTIDIVFLSMPNVVSKVNYFSQSTAVGLSKYLTVALSYPFGFLLECHWLFDLCSYARALVVDMMEVNCCTIHKMIIWLDML